MKTTVTAVIPTVGRPSLNRAVQSVLEQTRPVDEIIVVADTAEPVALPDDDRITLLRPQFRVGAARCRQMGIDAAEGSVIALLDDDDEWYTTKLERQLAAVAAETGAHWVASSRIAAICAGNRKKIWPRRIITQDGSVPDYLFRFKGIGLGGSTLQASTLCFPTELARKVHWKGDAGGVNDEPGWLIRLQRAYPDLRVIQLPDVLSTYNATETSVSRQRVDCTQIYIEWGLQYLRTESPRVLGDYLCTIPVSAAVSARSWCGVLDSLRSAFRYGHPGLFAIGYAVMNAARVAMYMTTSVVRQ
jgi:glycosyltransferase involved in cell wall biosynthesis